MPKNQIIPYNPKLKELARKLRKNMGHAEVLLWQKIRGKSLGFQFHRQVPMLEYIVDFYCHELLLAIEVDNGVHKHPKISINDLERQKLIETYGVHFLRFDNKKIKQDISAVLQEIENWIKFESIITPPDPISSRRGVLHLPLREVLRHDFLSKGWVLA